MASSVSCSSRPSSSRVQKPSQCCFSLDRFLRIPEGCHRCPIDGGVLRDAVKSRVCGHVYGLQCAIYFSLEKEKCPVCAAPLDASDLEPHDVLRQQISNLKATCPEGERCRWTGTLEASFAHVNGPTCAVQRIDCPFCDKKGIEVGQSFEAHKEACEECVVICQQCCEDMPRRHLALHVKSCKGEMIEPLKRQKQNMAPPPAMVPQADPLPINTVQLDGSANHTEEIDKDAAEEAPSEKQASVTRVVDTHDTLDASCGAASIMYSEDDFSPAPPPGTVPTSRAPSNEKTENIDSDNAPDSGKPCLVDTTTVSSSKRAEEAGHAAAAQLFSNVESTRLPCPLAAVVGCTELHDLSSPAVMWDHMMKLGTAMMDLKSSFEALRGSHSHLEAVVEQQKKTIKMLEVKNALHSGKLQLPQGKNSTSGLVDSPRLPTSSVDAAAAGDDKTPLKRAAASAAHAIGRSASSPATDRSFGREKGHTFVPSMPTQQKKPSGTGAAAAGRRPSAA